MEALIFLANNTHTDPVKERRGCWKRGMVVTVQEDGWTWGRMESKQVWIAEGNAAAEWPNQGRMGIVKIPGVPAAKALALLEPQDVDDAGVPYYENLAEAQPRRATYRRKAWRLLVDNVPLAIRQTMLADGEITVTVSQIRNYLKRIRDDAQFTDLD